jgi:hypothetical protein
MRRAAIMAALAIGGCASGPTGRYEAPLAGVPGFYQLTIAESDEVTFLVVITEHVPPAELESLRGKLVRRGSALCIEPAPAKIEPCFEANGDTITVRTLDGERITLKRASS